MSLRPDYYAVELDQWQSQMKELRGQAKEELLDALSQCTTPQELRRVVQPIFDRYMWDIRNMEDGKYFVRALASKFFIDDEHLVRMELTYNAKHQKWITKSDKNRSCKLPADEKHAQIVEDMLSIGALSDMFIGDVAHYISKRREIMEPYAYEIEKRMNARTNYTAATYREPFNALVMGIYENLGFPKDELILTDQSPNDHITHFVAYSEDENFEGHIIAVAPGKSMDTATLLKELDLDIQQSQLLLLTDHINFHWPFVQTVIDRDLYVPSPRSYITWCEMEYRFANGPEKLILPSQKDADIAAYHKTLDDLMIHVYSAIAYVPRPHGRSFV